MDEIFSLRRGDFAEYEELILQRERAKKEAMQWEIEYTRVFGGRQVELFELQIRCIQKKKQIHYYQMQINQGRVIDLQEISASVEREMKAYRQQMTQMLEERDLANAMAQISPSDLQQIKKIYRRLAKLLHPDISPRTETDPRLAALWQMIQASYQANDLEDLQDAEILARRALEEMGASDASWEIPLEGIAEKMDRLRKEILEIKSTDPYQYKYLLTDPKLIVEKKREIEKRKREYMQYEEELKAAIDKMLWEGGVIRWDLN